MRPTGADCSAAANHTRGFPMNDAKQDKAEDILAEYIQRFQEDGVVKEFFQAIDHNILSTQKEHFSAKEVGKRFSKAMSDGKYLDFEPLKSMDKKLNQALLVMLLLNPGFAVLAFLTKEFAKEAANEAIGATKQIAVEAAGLTMFCALRAVSATAGFAVRGVTTAASMAIDAAKTPIDGGEAQKKHIEKLMTELFSDQETLRYAQMDSHRDGDKSVYTFKPSAFADFVTWSATSFSVDTKTGDINLTIQRKNGSVDEIIYEMTSRPKAEDSNKSKSTAHAPDRDAKLKSRAAMA